MEDNYRHKGLRKALVNKIQEKGITSQAVLDAVSEVPRHFFFDQAFLEHAYQDKAFPIGYGQTISQPFTVAFQTEKLRIAPGMKVLEVGTGSGYQACILCAMGANVYTIEVSKPLFEKARKLLPRMGYRPRFFLGDGSRGLPAFAPYDRIIVTAGAPVVPASLIGQLAPQGILIIPVGDRKTQKMMEIHKAPDGEINEIVHENFSFVPLIGREGWKE